VVSKVFSGFRAELLKGRVLLKRVGDHSNRARGGVPLCGSFKLGVCSR